MVEPSVPPTLRVASEVAWRLLVVAAAIVVAVLLLAKLRVLIVPVFVAILLATLLVPPAAWLRSRGVPNALAALAVLLGSLVVLVGVGLAIVPPFFDELDDVGSAAQEGFARIVDRIAAGPFGLTEADVERGIERAVAQLRENAASLSSGVLSGAIILVEVLAGLLLTLVLLFFFVKDGERIWERGVDLLPSGRRADARELGARVWTALTAYVRGVALVSVVDAVLIAIALVLIGVPLVLPLAMLTFIGGFFPIVGAFAAGFVAALVALVSEGVLAAVLVVAAITIIQQLEGDVLYPVVVGRSIRLHPIAILLALTAGAVLGGVIGAFIAVPVAAVVSVAAGFVRERREAGGDGDYTAPQLGRRAPA